MTEELILKRLSIIKLLFKNGQEQSYKGELTAPFSILSFHDSVEMFLKLLAEVKDKKDCQNFMDYWEKFTKLTQKEAMRNLNSCRVNLKHKGITTSRIDIESSRVNTNSFFEQNTKIFFDLEFKEISLFELIKYNKPRELLIEANKSLEEGKFEDCAFGCAKAFNELLIEYKSNKNASYSYGSAFDLVRGVSFNNSPRTGGIKTPIGGQLKDVFRTINENFKNIEKMVQVVALGIDYRKYLKFDILTPSFYKSTSGEYQKTSNEKKKWNINNCEFLIDFVLDSALILQDFDFNFSDLASDGRRLSINAFRKS